MSRETSEKTRVGVITLGCPKNTVDSEEMLRALVDADEVELQDQAEDAEVVVINTCAFIGPAKEESIEAILEAVERKKEGRHRGIVITGCLSERYREELSAEIPEVDEMLGIAPGQSILEACATVADRNQGLRYEPRGYDGTANEATSPCPDVAPALASRLTPRWTGYLKISEGCDNPCTFCAIPSFRGRHRSKPPEQVLAEAQSLAAGGAVEINVIAQDTTSYGMDFPAGPRLHELLPMIAATDGIAWTRLLYAYPRFVTDDLIGALADTPSVCKYVDMPLQHASGTMLKRMGRGMHRGELTDLLLRMRDRIPGLVLRTTMIVGFPGETESEFEELIQFLTDVRFERLGAFTYSPEDGTPAFRLEDDVPEELKEDRYHRLMSHQRDIAFDQNEEKIGSVIECLIEGRDRGEGKFVGRSWADAPEIDGSVFLEVDPEKAPAGPPLTAGQIVRARVHGADGYDLHATLVDDDTDGSRGVSSPTNGAPRA